MAHNLNDIKNTLVRISKGKDLLSTLMEFERTLDNAEVFAYRNWINGELVDGPHISRYWHKTTWMYPEKLMPDPDAGLRLTKLGCKVYYAKAVIELPIKVRSADDWQDSESKKAKLKKHNIWLVTVEMPIKYINNGLDMSDDELQRHLSAANDEISDAYSEAETAADINTGEK